MSTAPVSVQVHLVSQIVGSNADWSGDNCVLFLEFADGAKRTIAIPKKLIPHLVLHVTRAHQGPFKMNANDKKVLTTLLQKKL